MGKQKWRKEMEIRSKRRKKEEKVMVNQYKKINSKEVHYCFLYKHSSAEFLLSSVTFDIEINYLVSVYRWCFHLLKTATLFVLALLYRIHITWNDVVVNVIKKVAFEFDSETLLIWTGSYERNSDVFCMYVCMFFQNQVYSSLIHLQNLWHKNIRKLLVI